MALSFSPTIITTNLEMHLDPNNIKSYEYPTSGTSWKDLTRNQNNATLVGSPTYKNTSGGYFSFNGSSQYASVAHSSSLAPTNALAICCWVRLSNWNISTDARIISKIEGGGYSLSINNTAQDPNNQGKLTFQAYFGGAYVYSTYSLSDISSGWHYIVGTTDGRYLDLYIDGVLVNRTIRTTLDPIKYGYENSLQIGAEAGPGSTPQSTTTWLWPGSIGMVSIYSRYLSENEILQNFWAIRARYINPDGSQSRLLLNLDATNYASYPGTGTSWNDLSGQQNNTTLSSTTYDVTSGSFSFDGTSTSYAERAAINPENFITIDVWVKWTSFGTTSGGYAMVSNSLSDGQGSISYGYLLYQGTTAPYNRINFAIKGTLGTGGSISSNLINTGVWYNIVATYDGKKCSLYINGVLDVQTTAVLGNILPATSSFLIGSTYLVTGNKFNGNISAVKIYSRALSSQEIFQNYQAIRRRYELVEYDGPQIINSGLILNLDSGNPLSYPKTGTSWLDLSGNNNHGTLTNGPVYNKARSGFISFDGIDDVVVTNDANFRFNTPEFTLCVMFYWKAVSTASALISKRNGTTPYQQYTISIAGDLAASTPGKYIQLLARDDNNSVTVGLQFDLTPLSAGWYYVVGTVSATSQQLYLNGLSKASSTLDLTGKTYNITGRNLCIGAAVNDAGIGYSYFYGGNISRVQVYNRALSADEVTQNFKAVRGRYGL